MASRVSCGSDELSACRRCPAVVPGSAVPGTGPAGAELMFVGEAPGRLGAARTGVPFLGDVSGRRFELLLAAAGMARDEIFVTNAVHCLPLDAEGRNRRPRTTEVRECSSWLAMEVAAVDPRLVVALGTVAMDALARIEPHGLALGRDTGRRVAWHGRELVALYHPGARSAVHRSWELQMEDWKRFGAATVA